MKLVKRISALFLSVLMVMALAAPAAAYSPKDCKHARTYNWVSGSEPGGATSTYCSTTIVHHQTRCNNCGAVTKKWDTITNGPVHRFASRVTYCDTHFDTIQNLCSCGYSYQSTKPCTGGHAGIQSVDPADINR